MVIYSEIDKIKTEGRTAVTVGKFDGLHPGHMDLIKTAVSMKSRGCAAVLFKLEGPGQKMVLSREEEARYAEEAGVDIMIRLPFTEEIRQMEAEDFVKKVLCEKLSASFVICGEDFCFGKGRGGNTGLLRELEASCGFSTIVRPPVKKDGSRISSSLIRSKFESGALREALYYLEHPYRITGEIVHGRALGRKLGFPTINVYPDADRFLPHYGVYFTRVTIDGITYGGMANLGIKPTVSGEQGRPIAEVHLLRAEGDLYGKCAEIEFKDFIRAEKRFDSLEELKKAVLSDIACTEEMNSAYIQ